MNNSDMTRRKFLASCGKMTGIGAMSSIINLSMFNKVLAARTPGSISDYKGLVCVFLDGGCDSFNMLVPRAASAYNEYLQRRGPRIGLSRERLLSIQDLNTEGAGGEYYVNGAMPGVQQMFNSADMAFVTNVGTLVEPLTKAEFQSGSKARPLGIGSHFDQRVQWQNSLPNVRGGSLAGQGWVGRMAEILNDTANNNATVSVNLAPGGNNILQTSRSGRPLTVRGGSTSSDLYNTKAHLRTAINADLEFQYQTLLQNHYNYVRKEAIEQNNELVSLERTTTIQTRFPDSDVGRQLLQVAKYIKMQGLTYSNRQTFFVKQGGYDTHKDVSTRLNRNLGELSAALTAFNTAMKEIGYHDKVVTYTASDFGRTLSSNGSGTGHAWGGNSIVMGGPVAGGRLIGEYPNLYAGASQDIGRGRMLPTTSVDELHASIAHWFGISNDVEMEQVLPNIRNFWQRTNINVAGDPIGLFV